MHNKEVFEDHRYRKVERANSYDEEVSYWQERIRQDLDLLERAEELVAGDDKYASYLDNDQPDLAMSYAIVEYAKELVLSPPY